MRTLNLASPGQLRAGPRHPIRVRAEADEAHVYLYEAIGGWWGVLAADFVKELAQLTASTIHLHINSPGGDVFEARAMATAIRGHKSKVVAHVDGLAASAATWVALAAAEVEIAKGAFFMIHRSWTLAMGNAGELREQADLLEKVDGTIVDDYVEKTGKDRDLVVAWMDAETWFTAEEALEHGFVDRLAEKEAEAPDDSWNLEAFKNAPRTLVDRPAAKAPAAPPAPASDDGEEDRRRMVAMLEAIG